MHTKKKTVLFSSKVSKASLVVVIFVVKRIIDFPKAFMLNRFNSYVICELLIFLFSFSFFFFLIFLDAKFNLRLAVEQVNVAPCSLIIVAPFQFTYIPARSFQKCFIFRLKKKSRLAGRIGRI